MIKKIIIFNILFFNVFLPQQENKTYVFGKVEYTSSQFIYVNFENTEGIEIGDTLFVSEKNRNIPKLIVQTKSSRSCASIAISGNFNKGDEVFAIIKSQIDEPVVIKEEKKNIVPFVESEEVKLVSKSAFGNFISKKDNLYGRFSITGYSNLSNENRNEDYQKWRYSLSFNADKINGSRFSFSNYMTFRYRANEWSYTAKHISDAFKVYDLALTYDLNSNTKFLLGRKINPKHFKHWGN